MNLAAGDSEWISTTAIGGIALVLAVAVVFVVLARRFRQPAVIGEITAGICLGPSVLGLLPGDLPERFFPTEIRPYLGVVAEVALLLFMFIIGWEFNLRSLRGRRRSMSAIWFVSVALPLVSGVALAAFLFGSHGTVNGERIDFVQFALFLGTAMAITAFPVLARIITDKKLQNSMVGTLALALAALDDIFAWCLLAVVVALVTASGAGGFAGVAGWGVVYVAVMAWLVRPALRHLARYAEGATLYVAPLVAAGALASAYVTSHIGLHTIFGAFAFGLVMPRAEAEASVLHRAARIPLENLSKLLLPVFFVVTGLSVDLTSLTGAGLFHMVLIILVACLGKFGGVLLSARATGIGWSESTMLGLLMNTRGLTELVLLNVGLSLGLLSTELFTAMVIMALVTTAMASPLLTLVMRRHQPEAAAPAASDVAPVQRGG